jgi:hypothetical protein
MALLEWIDGGLIRIARTGPRQYPPFSTGTICSSGVRFSPILGDVPVEVVVAQSFRHPWADGIQAFTDAPALISLRG